MSFALNSTILRDPNETKSQLATVALNSTILRDPNETKSQLATVEFNQVSIADTAFNFVEQCDLEIKNIKMYGVLNEDGKCEEPFFRVCDVIKYNGTLRNNRKAVENAFKKKYGVSTVKKVACDIDTIISIVSMIGIILAIISFSNIMCLIG